jgi:hypothetical protein
MLNVLHILSEHNLAGAAARVGRHCPEKLERPDWYSHWYSLLAISSAFNALYIALHYITATTKQQTKMENKFYLREALAAKKPGVGFWLTYVGAYYMFLLRCRIAGNTHR